MKPLKISRVTILADGASLSNPGPAAIGAIVKSGQGENLVQISRRIGRATNNQAEYQALIAALEEAVKLGAGEVDIKLDSELLVKQLSGQYRVKAKGLKPLYQKVRILLGRLSGFTINHISSRRNSEAHRLAHMALR